MSGQCTGWVLRHGPKDRAMRAVLICIADATNRDGEEGRPGMQAIVEGALYSEGHVRRTIAKLIEGGWVEQTENPGPGKVAAYRVPMDNTAHGARRTPRTQERAVVTTENGVHRADTAQTPRTQERAVRGGHPIVGITETETEGSAASAAEDDPLHRHAHRLCVLAFEQPVKPALRDGGRGAFPAALSLIERVLRAGTPVGLVELAITEGVEVWTLAGLQTAVARARPRQNGGDPMRGHHEESLTDLAARAMGE